MDRSNTPKPRSRRAEGLRVRRPLVEDPFRNQRLVQTIATMLRVGGEGCSDPEEYGDQQRHGHRQTPAPTFLSALP